MPYKQIPKASNWIQESRSPVKNEKFQEDIDSMTSAGVLPPGLQFRTQREFETEGFLNRLSFSVKDNEYQLKRTSKADGSTEMFTGTLEWIAAQQDFEVALLQREAREIAEQDVSTWDPEDRSIYRWLTETIHGREYNTIKCPATWERMKEEVAKSGQPIDEYSLQSAYVRIVDNPDQQKNFNRFFAKRDRLAQEAAEAAAQNVPRVEPELAATPFVNNRQSQDVRSTPEANAARKMSTSELRRKAIPALSGEKIQTTPSTGSGRSF